MVSSSNKPDYQEAIDFVNIPRSYVASYRGKRKTIIVGERDTLIKNKFLSGSIDTIARKDGIFVGKNLIPKSLNDYFSDTPAL